MTHAFMNERFFWSPGTRTLWFNGPPETPGYTPFPLTLLPATRREITESTTVQPEGKGERIIRTAGAIVTGMITTITRSSAGERAL